MACHITKRKQPTVYVQVPPFLSADKEMPNKEEATAAHASRFKI